MQLTHILKTAEKLFIDNSPAILTGLGVVGTVTTAVLTGRATYSAALIEVRDYYDVDDFFNDREKRPGNVNRTSARELVRRHWKLYIPAVATGALTIGAIVGANQIGTRRAAGLAAAFSLSERAHAEYKERVVERFGEAKERAMRDDLAQERVSRTEGSREIIIVGTDVLCFDAFTGRYFQSNMEELRKAENDINAMILNNTYASLTDLYNCLGIPKTTSSDEIGWNINTPLKLEYSTTMSADGRPCLSIEYDVDGVRDYWKMG
jgi:hypothetical protein